MTARSVDLSSDVGERPGDAGLADDFALLALVTSANVACGGHAGDRTSMRIICEAAVTKGVAIGAQVSYVDREGFGRRRLDVPHATLVEQLREQWGELAEAARAAGGHAAYMRPHGALYNAALVDVHVASAVVDATPAGLPVLCLAGTALAAVAEARGHPVAPEIFADRAVTDEGLLVPRGTPGAVIDDPEHVAARLTSWLHTGHLTSHSGGRVSVAARSICVHSDTPGAVQAAAQVRAALLAAGARLSAFARDGARTATDLPHHVVITGAHLSARRITVHQYGERALLVDVEGFAPTDLVQVVRGMFGPEELLNVVPAAECVLLTFARPTPAERVDTLLRHGLATPTVADAKGTAAHAARPGPAAATYAGADSAATADIGAAAAAETPTVPDTADVSTLITIDVRYDGADLADVARTLDATVDEVIALHSQSIFHAGFFGFSPGFAYLTGLHPRLHLPRRATPRTAVPAGAVAIAAAYSAVYPRTSPGGWHLIGHTDAVMFDPHRTPPTLVTPGAKVRFRPV